MLHQTLQQILKLIAKFSNWYYTATDTGSSHRQRSAARSQPRLRSGAASVYQSTSFTGAAVVYTLLYQPQMLQLHCLAYHSSFLAKNNVVNVADIRCSTSFFAFRYTFSSWSVVVFINTFKNYPELFLHFFYEKSMNTLLPTWLLHFYLIFIKIRSYSLNSISWIIAVCYR